MATIVRVKQVTDFVRTSRQIEPGDELEVQHISKYADKNGKDRLHYLVNGKNGKPISLYEEEVEVIQN